MVIMHEVSLTHNVRFLAQKLDWIMCELNRNKNPFGQKLDHFLSFLGTENVIMGPLLSGPRKQTECGSFLAQKLT